MSRIDWPAIIDRAVVIVESYDTSVTLRQLFYRLVSEHALPNNTNAYKRLSSLTAERRRGGTFPTLIDRGREIHRPTYFASPVGALRQLRRWYRLDRTVGQDVSLYLGVEKAGMVIQLESWFGEYGIPILALGGCGCADQIEWIRCRCNRRGIRHGRFVVLNGVLADVLRCRCNRLEIAIHGGRVHAHDVCYDSSQTYVDDVRDDIQRQTLGDRFTFDDATKWWRPAVLLYAGDFDPSGEDIDRDFIERTGCFDKVIRVALSAEQVVSHRLPINAGKDTDSRAAGFIERHGELVQVELDALDPAILRELFTDALAVHWDTSAYEFVLAQEREDLARLTAAVDGAS
jgi:hypothetical protein